MEKLRWIYRAWRYRFKLEKQEITCVRRLLRRGDVAVDIGAHKGGYTYWMLRKVGRRGKVYAFEPQPQLCNALRELMPGANVIIENMGLSSASGVLTLNVPSLGVSPGASFEALAGEDATKQSYPVQVTSLDEYFDGGESEQVRLIKCDAEGHELEIFRGAENLLRRHYPHLVFECETRHRASGSVGEVFSFLKELGYRGYFIATDGLHAIDEFDPAVHQAKSDSPGYVNNFLFSRGTRD